MRKLIVILVVLSILGCEDQFAVHNLTVVNLHNNALLTIGPPGGKALEYDFPFGSCKEMSFDPGRYYIAIESIGTIDYGFMEIYVSLEFGSITTVRFKP